MPKNIDFSALDICGIIQASRGKQRKTERQKINDFSKCRKYDIIQSSRGKQQNQKLQKVYQYCILSRLVLISTMV